MTKRKYTAIVTVTLITPKGKVLGTKAEDVTLKLNMKEFASAPQADDYMEDELNTLLAAGVHNIEECFGD